MYLIDLEQMDFLGRLFNYTECAHSSKIIIHFQNSVLLNYHCILFAPKIPALLLDAVQSLGRMVRNRYAAS